MIIKRIAKATAVARGNYDHNSPTGRARESMKSSQGKLYTAYGKLILEVNLQ